MDNSDYVRPLDATPGSRDPGQMTGATPEYIRGYNDGYSGAWLAPLQWTILGDYRSGWTKGNYDKVHNLPNPFAQS